MPTPRFSYRVSLDDGHALLSMDCGNGVHRARTMPLWLLRSIADICRTCAGTIDRYRADALLADDVPAFPDCIPITTIPLGPCEADVVASRTEDGTVEISVGLYDAGDVRAPALLLVQEQIPAFVRTVEALLAVETTEGTNVTGSGANGGEDS